MFLPDCARMTPGNISNCCDADHSAGRTGRVNPQPGAQWQRRDSPSQFDCLLAGKDSVGIGRMDRNNRVCRVRHVTTLDPELQLKQHWVTPWSFEGSLPLLRRFLEAFQGVPVPESARDCQSS